MKERESMWDTLVVGDTRGEMTMDEATIAAIHERLKHLTSDKWVQWRVLFMQPLITTSVGCRPVLVKLLCLVSVTVINSTQKVNF